MISLCNGQSKLDVKPLAGVDRARGAIITGPGDTLPGLFIVRSKQGYSPIRFASGCCAKLEAVWLLGSSSSGR
jgi:hypothetical protein